ncbi:GGDEF domain-containing protein [Paludisphaera rhizosphaerae]|uniref:GGDEF domain-containing protein n=1 Tax=Paludisphaera rhizosphaerae TaxID=2711216 RepID=UPI0013ECCA8B|nr:GGDEF domain-containing protein [Paludisphaera rhizosphaerae]
MAGQTLAAATVAEASIHDFTAVAAAAADVEVLRGALVAAVKWVSDGAPASLILDSVVEECEPPRFGSGPGSSAVLPIRTHGGKTWGAILLGKQPDEPACATGLTRRRLETLAAIAALAFDRLAMTPRRSEPVEVADTPADTVEAVHDATLLSAVLPFALGQARRNKEPLSILCVAINQLRGIRELFGKDEADRIVAGVGARIAGLLRSSDLVCRLDDDRVMVVLPRVELRDAVRVGEKLARKIADSGEILGVPIAITLAVGAASLPTSATTLGGLLDAVDLALCEARRRRPGSVAAAPLVVSARGDEEPTRLLVADRDELTC